FHITTLSYILSLHDALPIFIQSAMKNGGAILGTRLPGFRGLLKRELMPGIRLGTELAKRAVFWGRVGGIFHSDELPGYGITEGEIGRAHVRTLVTIRSRMPS